MTAKARNAAGRNSPAVDCVMTIRNQRGLHARAAAKFVKLAASFNAEITVSNGEQTVSGLSIMGLMMLAAGINSKIVVSASGPQAGKAMEALRDMIETKFGED